MHKTKKTKTNKRVLARALSVELARATGGCEISTFTNAPEPEAYDTDGWRCG